jgi:hypothetical protein
MQSRETKTDCQLTNLLHIIEGPQEKPPKSLRRFIKVTLGRRGIRSLKKIGNNWINYFKKLRGNEPIDYSLYNPGVDLKSGDLIRVRMVEEIKATLDHFRQLKGCSFAPEMEQYCGTYQTVLKQVERFVDERDFKILRTKGIYLLDGIYCQGVASLGRCDRNCFFFWREEWLEKVTPS